MSLRARRAVILAAALLLTGAAAGQQAEEDLDALARRALDLLNATRHDAGLEPLRLDAALSLLAVRHSREQANRGTVSHHSYEFGLSTERRVLITYPQVPRLAENVGRGRTVERLHEALLRSDGHRGNRLDAEFTHVGIGLARRGPYLLYLTEVFVTAPAAGLGAPLAYYFDAAPGSYEARDNPRVERGPETIRVGPPGPDDPEHWTSRGIDAYEAGDLAGAEADFRKALGLSPDYHYATYNLARVLVDSGRAAQAVVLLDALLERDPDDLTVVTTRGNAALLLQDYTAAEGYFRTVLSERLRDAGSWYSLGLALEYQDRRAEAESAYRQALHIDPSLRPAQVGLARVMR